MTPLNGGNILRLALDQITVGARLRRASVVQVQNLILMAEDTGITTPIHVRRVKGNYELIDGAHRLAAAKELGLPDIAALAFECRQDEARAMEASNNLGAARMSPLQTSVFVASWKRDYYALHPDRKPGLFKGNQHSGKVVGELSSLTTAVAECFGISERWAFKILSVGERLSPAEIAHLEQASRPVAMKDLLDLNKIADPDERSAVVLRLAVGNAKSVGEARRTLKAEAGGVPVLVKDRVEEGMNALSTLWSRLPKEARRRFVGEHATEIAALLDGEDAAE